jgi:hypothetical protein
MWRWRCLGDVLGNISFSIAPGVGMKFNILLFNHSKTFEL